MLVCSVKLRMNFASGLGMDYELIKDDSSVEYAKKVMEFLPMDYCAQKHTKWQCAALPVIKSS